MLRSIGSLPVAAGLLALLPAALPAQGVPAQAKVESQVLIVGEPGLQYGISPKGLHTAAVVLRGSRQVLVYDGVDGPKFEEILTVPDGGGSFTKATWSEDGNHYAYFGRVGQDYVVIVDGKEVHRGPWSAELAGQGQSPVFRLDFTPGDKHWYLIVQTRTSGRQNFQLIVDGKPGPLSQEGLSPVWSPDGEHHAYLQTVFPISAPRPTNVLILDGRPAGYLAGEPQFTTDGLHLFTKRQIPNTDLTEVLADGQPFMRVPSVQLHMAPKGPGVIGVAWTPFQNGVRAAFVTVGNRRVAGSECTASAGINGVYFSADAKHWAARCPTWIMADGKKSLEYAGGIASGVAFTADGRAVFQAKSNGKTFLIIGEQESDGYASIAQEMARTRAEQTTSNFEPPPAVIRGNTVAYAARLSLNDQRTVVVVGGKAYPATNASEVGLSPDGSRHAFLSGQPYQFVTVDGVPYADLSVNGSQGNIGFQGNFQWTPDSKHIAWVAFGEGRSRPGIAIDGKFIPTQGPPRFLAFTKDGHHLVWLFRSPIAPRHLIFVDGEQVLDLPQNLPLENEADIYWSMGEDGSINLVAQDGNEIKRFRITPGAGANVETLLAKAAKPH